MSFFRMVTWLIFFSAFVLTGGIMGVVYNHRSIPLYTQGEIAKVGECIQVGYTQFAVQAVGPHYLRVRNTFGDTILPGIRYTADIQRVECAH